MSNFDDNYCSAATGEPQNRREATDFNESKHASYDENLKVIARQASMSTF